MTRVLFHVGGILFLLMAVLVGTALGLHVFAPSASRPLSLAHTIRQTRSDPRRVYFCATHTKNYAALVECLRNV